MHRCLLFWLVATAAAALVTAWVAPELSAAVAAWRAGDGLAEQPFARLLVWTAAGSLVGCVAWGWAAASLVIGQALLGRPARNTRGVPRWLRQAVLVACGLAVIGTGSAAHADEGTGQARAEHRPVLSGLPSPERAVGSVMPPTTPYRAGTHVVRPGDTLWDIAEADLDGPGDAAAVTVRWRLIHALNRDVIGPDPDLIHPGQELRLHRQELDR